MKQTVLEEVLRTEMTGTPPRHALPDLPYGHSELEPNLSREQLEFHHDKHHAKYVEKLNNLTEGTQYEGMPLQDIVMQSTGDIFNNAAQAWNHTFYWHCLTPEGGKCEGAIADAINSKYGSFDEFQKQFNQAATSLFGSGWVWLTKDDSGELQIIQASNADNPLRLGRQPLLTCDMWEHAYYIDYRNAKAEYLDAFWRVVNWDFVNERYAS